MDEKPQRVADSKEDRAAALQMDEKAIMTAINAIVPAGRERCLAVTKIEEAFLWAIRGVERG